VCVRLHVYVHACVCWGRDNYGPRASYDSQRHTLGDCWGACGASRWREVGTAYTHCTAGSFCFVMANII